MQLDNPEAGGKDWGILALWINFRKQLLVLYNGTAANLSSSEAVSQQCELTVQSLHQLSDL
jgi:hypothetical protein